MESPAVSLSVRQAAFIGVGSMVGAGIFSLLGAAGEVAGSAVWISFVIAGIAAMLQGYSFAKFGAPLPSAGGLLEYVIRGFALIAGIVAWLVLATNAIMSAWSPSRSAATRAAPSSGTRADQDLRSRPRAP